MSRNGGKRASFIIPDMKEKQTLPLRSKSSRSSRKPSDAGGQTPSRRRNFISSDSSPGTGFLRCLRAKVARALRLFSRRQRTSSRARSYVDPSATPGHFAPARDSCQSEAIDDCIEFINASYRKSV